MAIQELLLDERETAGRLHEMGGAGALAYGVAAQASFEARDSNGYAPESMRSIFEEDEARLYLAFIGDAIARLRPRSEGEPELFYVEPAQALLRQYAPDYLRFFDAGNEVQQREVYEEMQARIVPAAGEPPSPSYVQCVALGYYSLGGK